MNGQKISRVRPAQRWNGFAWREMWEHRELVEALVRREIQVRYRQTFAGVVWVLGQPLITTIVLSVLVTRLAGQSSGNVPYPLFVYVAMVAWAYFSHALTKAAMCFVEQAPLIQRVCLPRLLIPFSVAVAALTDFGIALLFLPVLWIIYHVVPSLTILVLPLVIVLMIVTVFGMSLFLATLNAEYRDIAFALPFVLQLGLFITPMFYATDIIPLPWRWLYALNPMVGVVEGMRWSLLNPSSPAPLALILISTCSAVVILIGSLYLFQYREPNLADVI